MTDQTNQTNRGYGYGEEDKSDALEAFGTFNKARNLFFWIFLLIPLLLVQAEFWAVNYGIIDQVLITDKAAESAQVEKTTDGEETTTPPAEVENNDSLLEGKNQNKKAKSPDKLIQAALMTGNCVLTFAAVVYCLTMLIGIKLALIGRLGGLADLSKAFFLSLIAMVLILPWQHMMDYNIPGTLFHYENLAASYRQIKIENDLRHQFLYYGRYVGLWGLTLLLLFVAQWRSCQSVRKIRQRLKETENNQPAGSVLSSPS